VGISKKGFIFEHDVAASSILAYREFRVLCALRIFAGRSGRAWPSVQTIATTARCSVVAARIGLRGLQGKGFLVRDGKFFDLQDDRIRIAVGPTIEFGSSGEDPNSIVEDPNSIVRRSEFDRPTIRIRSSDDPNSIVSARHAYGEQPGTSNEHPMNIQKNNHRADALAECDLQSEDPEPEEAQAPTAPITIVRAGGRGPFDPQAHPDLLDAATTIDDDDGPLTAVTNADTGADPVGDREATAVDCDSLSADLTGDRHRPQPEPRARPENAPEAKCESDGGDQDRDRAGDQETFAVTTPTLAAPDPIEDPSTTSIGDEDDLTLLPGIILVDRSRELMALWADLWRPHGLKLRGSPKILASIKKAVRELGAKTTEELLRGHVLDDPAFWRRHPRPEYAFREKNRERFLAALADATTEAAGPEPDWEVEWLRSYEAAFAHPGFARSDRIEDWWAENLRAARMAGGDLVTRLGDEVEEFCLLRVRSIRVQAKKHGDELVRIEAERLYWEQVEAEEEANAVESPF